GKSDVVRTKLSRPVSPRRRFCAQNTARSEARRHPGRATDQIRPRHQCRDRQGTGPRHATDPARPRRRGDRVKRREFITLLGGAAVAFVSRPFATHAQERMRRVGVLMNATAEEPEAQSYVAAFQQGMQEFGWSVGRNLRIDLRWGGGDADLTRRYAAELATLSPDVMLAAGGPVVSAMQRASRTVPIVFAQSIDPVGAGIVASLARPGGNATGFTQFEYGLSAKWVELLKEIAPGTKRVGVLRDPANPAGIGQWAIIQAAASAGGMEVS